MCSKRRNESSRACFLTKRTSKTTKPLRVLVLLSASLKIQLPLLDGWWHILSKPGSSVSLRECIALTINTRLIMREDMQARKPLTTVYQHVRCDRDNGKSVHGFIQRINDLGQSCLHERNGDAITAHNGTSGKKYQLPLFKRCHCYVTNSKEKQQFQHTQCIKHS